MVSSRSIDAWHMLHGEPKRIFTGVPASHIVVTIAIWGARSKNWLVPASPLK
jgi:hypothetical protein